ncbi:FkbM family methyltransferase [Neomegalonema sp.]|uniref:FkbM family methyltransferase n=1 Tax=Neomegalonema sp. TaxID=2039713 RepID=UPI00261B4968|nr:FkbM family methyltransferase [Neomegalonema sp.]MDD2869677.1 FkbM family methyltransferase [Neomegalonema sp.]
MKEIKLRYKEEIIYFIGPEEDHQIKMIESNGFYEKIMLMDSEKRLKEGDVVIDIGASIGNHSIFWSKVCKCKVYAFEPNPRALEFLGFNKIKNDANIEIYNIALGDKIGMGHLRIADNNIGNSTFVPGEGMINVSPLDMFGINNVRMMKIDVEGMESQVLRGAHETIDKFSPLIYMETYDNKASDILKSWGYKVTGVFNFSPTYLFEREKR